MNRAGSNDWRDHKTRREKSTTPQALPQQQNHWPSLSDFPLPGNSTASNSTIPNKSVPSKPPQGSWASKLTTNTPSPWGTR